MSQRWHLLWHLHLFTRPGPRPVAAERAGRTTTPEHPPTGCARARVLHGWKRAVLSADMRISASAAASTASFFSRRRPPAGGRLPGAGEGVDGAGAAALLRVSIGGVASAAYGTFLFILSSARCFGEPLSRLRGGPERPGAAFGSSRRPGVCLLSFPPLVPERVQAGREGASGVVLERAASYGRSPGGFACTGS